MGSIGSGRPISHRVSRAAIVKSDEFVSNFQLLRYERISRAWNEHSRELLNNYRHFCTYQISQGSSVKSALPGTQAGANTAFLGGRTASITVRGARPPMLLTPAIWVATGSLPRAKPRMWTEPLATNRTGLLLHGTLALP